jgi:signal transduction histidine kinase
MQDVQLTNPVGSAVPLAGAKRRLPSLSAFSLRVQISLVIFVAVVLSAATMQYWNYKTAFETELNMVRDKHLVIAQNLSAAFSRYVQDVSQIFIEETKDLAADVSAPVTIPLLSNFDIKRVLLVSPAGEVSSAAVGVGDYPASIPDPATLDDLRRATVEAGSQVYFSGIQTIDDTKLFLISTIRGDGLMAVGYLSTTYIKEMQKQIAFGDRGHSAIFDQFGRVIAHPSAEAEKTSADQSKLSIVQDMLARRTGVAGFFSPVMKADMVAGYTFVPETGWAVMVPQPIMEISSAVNGNLKYSYLIAALTAIVLSMLGWWLAEKISDPIERFRSFALRVADGRFGAPLPVDRMPSAEFASLSKALNSMASQVEDSSRTMQAGRDAAEEASRSKSVFLALMSHEMRTPLNGVIGLLTVCEDLSGEEKVQSLLRMAQRSAYSLSHLTDEVMTFSSLEHGRLSLQEEPVDLAELIGDVAQQFAAEAESRGITLVTPTGIPTQSFVSDPRRLRQIMGNLLGNGIKYSEQGTVELKVAITRDTAGSQLEIQVSDEGIGIAPQHVPLIFNDFYQVESSHSRRYDGLGIGLALTRRIVELMRGTVSCTSTLGKGSVFNVVVPISQVT